MPLLCAVQIFGTGVRSRWCCSSTAAPTWRAQGTCLTAASWRPTGTSSLSQWTTGWVCSVSFFFFFFKFKDTVWGVSSHLNRTFCLPETRTYEMFFKKVALHAYKPGWSITQTLFFLKAWCFTNLTRQLDWSDFNSEILPTDGVLKFPSQSASFTYEEAAGTRTMAADRGICVDTASELVSIFKPEMTQKCFLFEKCFLFLLPTSYGESSVKHCCA